jgi:hypothetical protein
MYTALARPTTVIITVVSFLVFRGRICHARLYST